MIDLLERYAPAALEPFQAMTTANLEQELVKLRQDLLQTWQRREALAGRELPRPATPPNRWQLALLFKIELTDLVLRSRRDLRPPGQRRDVAPCQVDYEDDPPYPGQVVATCLHPEGGHSVESWGHGERSLRRCFAVLSEECPCGLRHEEGEAPDEEDEEEDDSVDVVADGPVRGGVAVEADPHAAQEPPADLLGLGGVDPAVSA